jgi:chromosome segregation ATPase
MMRSFKSIVLPMNTVTIVVSLSLVAVFLTLPFSTIADTATSTSPWGTTMRTATTTTTTTMPFLELRGGGLFGGNKNKSNAQIYRESLEEQVMLLDGQLRQARTEISTVRERAKQQGKIDSLKRNRSISSNGKQKQVDKEEAKLRKQGEEEEKRIGKERRKEQKEALVRLQGEIRQLEQMKSELETLLETSANQIEELEQKLISQEKITIEMEESYKKQIIDLETKLGDVQRIQLQKLTDLHQTKIDSAVKDALKVQEDALRMKMEETTERLSTEHAKDMEKEKARSEKAVETERKKMRKLVRALALREKKLKLQQQQSSSSSFEDDKNENVIEKQKSNKAKTTVKTTSSFNNSMKNPPTNRGRR